MKKKIKNADLIGIVIFSILYGALLFHFCRKYTSDNSIHMLIRRLVYSALIYMFLLAHFLVDVKRMYLLIFKYRLVISIAIFIFLVANNINFSSIGMYDAYIQSGRGNEYLYPVFGQPRAIRSDEWVVSISRMMSGGYNHYGHFNHILRAASANNLTASGYEVGYWALANPASWGYYLLGSTYGLSFYWSFYIIFGALASFELIYLICGRKDIALLGMALIQFSPFNLWWSCVTALTAGNAAVALFGHFLKAKKPITKIACGFFMACFVGNYVVVLYPAWQVPFGYIFLFEVIYFLYRDRHDIQRSQLWERILFSLCVFFSASIIISYIMELRPYIKAVMQTTYPGARRDYGGYSLNKLFGYFISIFDFAQKRNNPCESATFFSLFPLGFALWIYIQARKKGKDAFLWFMGVPSVILLWYCSIGMPKVFAEASFMSYSTSNRAVDALAYLSVILLLYTISQIPNYELPLLFSGVLMAIILMPAVVMAQRDTEVTNKSKAVITATAVLVWIIVVELLSAKRKEKDNRKNVTTGDCKKTFIIILSSFILISFGLQIHPIEIGTYAITSKPAYRNIRKLVKNDPQKKWIAVSDNIVVSNFVAACGAPIYNSVHYIPNMYFWHIVDPNGVKNNIYNRYAHIIVNLDDNNSSIDLLQPDTISLKITYEELEKLNIDYIASTKPLQNQNVKQIYEEDGFYIYSTLKDRLNIDGN
ncbi:hypothetical protein ACKX2L_03285 [Lachnospiraceae bacterium YH-ros2228]